MPAFSAIDAIAPAVRRTRQLLFQPFRAGTFFKLCLVAVIADGSSGNFNFNVPTSSGHSSGQANVIPSLPFVFTPFWIAVAVAASLLILILSVFLFYLVVRLRFALFHCLTTNSTLIRPGWRQYREQAWRYFLLCIAVGFIFLAAVVVIALPFVGGFYRLFQSTQAGAPLNVPLLIGLILPLIPIILVLVLAGIAVSIVLRDLMLPHMALDNLSAGAAWRAVRAYLAAEKGAFFLYAVLRVLLPVAVGFVLLIVFALPTILVGLVIFSAIHSAFGSGSMAIMIVAALLGGSCAVAFIAAGICLGGCISIAFRNFALLFYGARYAVLGRLLFPPAPSPPTPVIEPAV